MSRCSKKSKSSSAISKRMITYNPGAGIAGAKVRTIYEP